MQRHRRNAGRFIISEQPDPIVAEVRPQNQTTTERVRRLNAGQLQAVNGSVQRHLQEQRGEGRPRN